MKAVDFYTGFTKNLKLRFEQHNNGLIESTENLLREDFFEKKAQILFNRVKGKSGQKQGGFQK